MGAQRISVEEALAAVVAAAQRLASAGGVIPIEAMSASDARAYDQLFYGRAQEGGLQYSKPTFRQRLLAEMQYKQAVHAYLDDAGGTDPKLGEINQRLIDRYVVITAVVEHNDSSGEECSPAAYLARRAGHGGMQNSLKVQDAAP